MANQSILAAFERMWYHIVSRLDNKADKSEVSKKSQVQIVTWEADD